MKQPDTPAWQALSACHAIDAIRGGTSSARELMRMTLAAIDAAEPAIGAFVRRLDDAAAVQMAAQASGPLHGLPIGLKDIFDTRDLPTAYGSPLYDDGQCARADAAIVGVIRAAGGVIVGKTTTTEFAYLQPTATRNPAAPGRTPGGSSAGSAAAVAAGALPWAIGTQTGGSTIRPASYCGIVGFKPSFDLLPTAGLKCFSWSLDTVGLFARDVADAAWLAQALSGRALVAPAVPRRSGWTVGVPRAYPWSVPSGNAQRAVDQAVHAWQDAGATILAIDLPPFIAELDAAHAAIQGWEATRALAAEAARRPDGLSPLLRAYLEGAASIDAATYARAQATAAEARQRFTDALRPCDVLLTPSAPDEAPPGLLSTGASDFSRAWTLLGVPCVNVPGLSGSNGAPMGVQLIGAAGADALVLQAAAALEDALNAHHASP
ncbi:MAG: amidase [Burkholderiaceae bacterium]